MDCPLRDNGHDRAGELRVIYVIPGADEGVSMSFSRRQAASVSRCGIAVRCFFLRSRTSPVAIWKELRRLRGAIQEFAPHIVHAHFGTMTAFVSAIASHTPLVITFHGSDLNPTPADPWLKSKLGHGLSHLAAMRASGVICVSRQLGERVAYLQDRVHVVPCGVNMDHFRPLPREHCRRKLGWNLDEKTVLFNARTDPIGKRLDLAEAAFAYAQRRLPNLRLHVFRGNTPPDEMPWYYSAADCLLMTSDYEGSPMVVKEAMTCNLPVVSVDVGDVAERLRGVTPSAIVARDPVALGEALVEVLDRDNRSNGRILVRDVSEEIVAGKIVSIYRSLADANSPDCQTNRHAQAA
jgi:glycosyltransferase involved in cell wall biosynthesis